MYIYFMPKKMLIDAAHAEETRVVVVDGNRVEEFDFESETRRQLAGNIYLAKVTRVEPSLQAAFVDYGGNRHGFLAFSEIHPDYYQIPIADREALMEEERAYAEAISLTFGDNKKSLNISEQIQPYVYYKETKGGGSTDVGDVSWAVPTGGFTTATYVPGTAGHSWQAASCTGTSIGIKGMLNAAKVMALTTYDLFMNKNLILKAQREFEEKRGKNFTYNPLIGDRAPALNYRK